MKVTLPVLVLVLLAVAAGSLLSAERCDINIDSWAGTRSDLTYWSLFYESTITVGVRVAPTTCTWKIDNTGKPSWIKLDVVKGNYVGDGRYKGPGTVDIRLSKNSGYGRNGRFRFATSSYSIPVDISQRNYTGACVVNPSGTNGTSSKTIEKGFISVVQNMAMPTNNFAGQIVDSSSCTLIPRPVAYTFGMNGTTISPIGGRPRTFDIRRPGIQANQRGEGALLSLTGYTSSDVSGVLALDLPLLGALPPGLQVTRQSLQKNFIAFGDGGGVVRVTGSVARASRDPGRPCAFSPEHYQVLGGATSGGWLSVTSESACKAGNPDAGTLVIAAQPSQGGRRVGAIFTPWGTVVFVVQA